MLVCTDTLCFVLVLSARLYKFAAFIAARKKQKEKPHPSWTQGTYIFNLLIFTYCLNGFWIFNDSLSPPDTETIILALLLCFLYWLVDVCCQALFHWIPFPCSVTSVDLSENELIVEQFCQPSSTLIALGCSFMATDNVQAQRALKMQKGWASTITDQCYFIAELKWKTDPLRSGFVSK